jgi:hypothetical protein
MGDTDDDLVPDVAVGRLPATSVEELDAMIDKVIGYETSTTGAWQSCVILAADNPDVAGDFEASSDSIAAVLPPTRVRTEVHLGTLGVVTSRVSLIGALNDGAAFMSFFGHGQLDRLAGEGLLVKSDVPGLSNGTRLPVITAMTCTVGQFSRPGYNCLAEDLILHPGGGAIAVWSPGGLSLNGPAEQMGQAFYGRVYGAGDLRLGDAVVHAMREYDESGIAAGLLDIYNLLGDPGLRITTSRPRTLNEWLRDWFSAEEMTDPETTGTLSDVDRDGIVTLGEYAWGLNPRVSDAAPMLDMEASVRNLPTHDAVLTFRRRAGALDLEYRIMLSSDLDSWTEDDSRAWVFTVDADAGGETELVSCRILTPEIFGRRTFVKLLVREIEQESANP